MRGEVGCEIGFNAFHYVWNWYAISEKYYCIALFVSYACLTTSSSFTIYCSHILDLLLVVGSHCLSPTFTRSHNVLLTLWKQSRHANWNNDLHCRFSHGDGCRLSKVDVQTTKSRTVLQCRLVVSIPTPQLLWQLLSLVWDLCYQLASTCGAVFV